MTSTRARREELVRQGMQPATLPLAEAAAYVGLSPQTFLTEVKAGFMPQPLPLRSRRKLWAVAALSRACGSSSSDVKSSDGMDECVNQAIANYAG